MRVLALSGSLRRDSLNTRLLRAAQELGGPGVEFIRYESLATIPPSTRSWSTASPPRCTSYAGGSRRPTPRLIATPEYNGSIPGQLKNALDWVSRPLGPQPVPEQADRRGSAPARRRTARCGPRPSSARCSG